MATCKITAGIEISCDDKRRLGGLNPRWWVFDVDSIESYTVDVDGYVTEIVFKTYGGTYKMESPDNACSAGYEVVVAEGGNKFFNHTAAIKLFATTPADDKVIEDMLVSNMGVIVETQNQEFLIYGPNNGLKTTEGSQNSGSEDASDVTDTLTMSGGDKNKPLRFFNTDEATTLTALESYEL